VYASRPGATSGAAQRGDWGRGLPQRLRGIVVDTAASVVDASWKSGRATAYLPQEQPGPGLPCCSATIPAPDIEYQAVLGRDWLSPWVEGGKFCGSRGMAVPLLGLKLRLKGAAAEEYHCSYMASFVDGTRAGPVPAGEACNTKLH
jgi:hypothetical protein